MIIFVYLALLAVAFFFLIVRPQRRQMAARRALIDALEVGDDIITAGGIYGTILSMSDTTMQVEVAPGVTLTVAREAVSNRQVPEVDEPDEDPALRSGEDSSDSNVGDSKVGDGDPPAEDG